MIKKLSPVRSTKKNLSKRKICNSLMDGGLNPWREDRKIIFITGLNKMLGVI